ncbi:YiiX family permuted papain-like enzyme [Achromobacter deleyi]|uniref:YiiX family permuted papain-like enzyme n=1 Tax=Achromobacter deleyi TaxID=1353891 RepID=UPI001491A070|nr:YiiX family permuted papain-like enzyme [Achromobacter deleyi]QVQ27083.1 YiiX family permuted papain-like enzyme [Achromobacter deleyi]UIP22668.1 YiiX family permuted papain-like enzyme [Achromobacter deleyi]
MRLAARTRAAAAAVLSALSVAAAAAPDFQTGDMVFQQSRSAQSLAIQQATHSPYSHMGMIVTRQGQPYVLEAAARVSYTPLSQWAAQGERGHYVVKRLRDTSLLTPQARERLAKTGAEYVGKPYDLVFAWSDEQIYCSELVWKIYQRTLGVKVGALAPLKSFDLASPAVRAKMQERYGKNIPWDEPIISPAAMYESDQLVTVGTF